MEAHNHYSISKGKILKKQKRQKSGSLTGSTDTHLQELRDDDRLDFNFAMPDFDELLELYKRKSVFGDELLPYGADKKTYQDLSVTIPITDGVDREKGEYSTIKKEDNEIESEVEILPICAIPDPLLTYLAVKAIVVDPHCELSAQRIILPPTSYYSYTITPFYLRCPNMQSYKLCYCEKSANKKNRAPLKIRARYEFFSSLPYLDVEPSTGQIVTGQNVKLNIIVRPRLEPSVILNRAKVLKAIAERGRLLKERMKSKERGRGGLRRNSARRSSKRKSSRGSSRKSIRRVSRKSRVSDGKKRKSMTGSDRKSMNVAKSLSRVGKRKSSMRKSDGRDKIKSTTARTGLDGKSGKRQYKKQSLGTDHEDLDIVVNPADVNVDNEDLFNAKLDLMKYKEPANFEAKVVCYMETELEGPPYTKQVQQFINVEAHWNKFITAIRRPELAIFPFYLRLILQDPDVIKPLMFKEFSFFLYRRKEELELYIYGTLARPDIVVFTPPNLDQQIKFETTAVGLKRKLFCQVYNTSGRTVLLNHSFFDASETFYIPLKLSLDQHKPNNYLKTGMWLEPDHHVTFPIIFAPKKEKTVIILCHA